MLPGLIGSFIPYSLSSKQTSQNISQNVYEKKMYVESQPVNKS